MSQKKRTRFFIAVEGPSEQSLIKWLQIICDDRGLHVHLDVAVLDGKSYGYMLGKAIKERNKRQRKSAKLCVMLVDADVGNSGNGWSCQKLRDEAAKVAFEVCFQTPKLEAILYRMHNGHEQMGVADSKAADAKLKKLWPEYQKPVNAIALNARFTVVDLLRAAQYDNELKNLLVFIGLVQN